MYLLLINKTDDIACSGWGHGGRGETTTTTTHMQECTTDQHLVYYCKYYHHLKPLHILHMLVHSNAFVINNLN